MHVFLYDDVRKDLIIIFDVIVEFLHGAAS